MKDWHNNNGLGREQSSGAGATASLDGGNEPRVHRPSLAALLAEAEVVSDEQVKEALEEGMRTGEKLGEVLVRRGWVGEERLAELLAAQWHMPFFKSDLLAVDSLAVRELKAADARRLEALPVWFEKDGGALQPERLMVAVAEPSEERFAAVRELLGEATIGFVVVARSALDRLLNSRVVGGEDRAMESTTAVETAPLDQAPAGRAVLEENAVLEGEDAAAPATAAGETEPHDQAPAENAVPDIAAVIDAFETATAQLRSIEGQLDVLAAALSEKDEQLAEQARLVAAAEAGAERDRATINALESELAQRGDLFNALKAKVAELNETLDTTP